MSRSITLGEFGGGNLNFMGEGRKIVGDVGGAQGGDNRTSLTVSNYRGRISFIPH
jgi:hypothetical protein